MLNPTRAAAAGAVLLLGTVTLLADHVGFGGPTYPVSGAPRAVVAVDLDDDGNVDVASADMHSDAVTLLRGNGTTALTPWTVVALPRGAGPFDMAAADLNRDGATDLIVANADNHSVSLLLGTHAGAPGDGGQQHLPVAGSPRGVAVADLNRDGKLDLAVTGASCHCVAILRNDGGGAFTEVTRVGGASQPHAIAVGDFNRDDLPDLVVASTGASAIEVLLGDGLLHFTRQRFGPAPGTRALVVLDFDRDGWLDVVTANAGVPILSVFRNDQGVLRYTAAVTTGIDSPAADRRGVAVVNMNGDGWPDLVVSVRSAGRIEQFSGTGTRFFPDGSTDDVGRPPPPSGGARPIAVADIDQNGRPDLIVGNEYHRSVSVLSNLSEWHQ